MKLTYRLMIRIGALIAILLAFWAAVFYFIILDEINTRMDKTLSDYSYQIVRMVLGGEKLPVEHDGINSIYFLKEVSDTYALETPKVRYSDEMIHMAASRGEEHVRVRRTIFTDHNGVNYELTAAVPTIEKRELRETYAFWLVFLFILMMIVLIITTWWVIRYSFKPFYVLLDWVRDFSLDHPAQFPEMKTTVTEFNRLRDVLLSNSEKNRSLYEQRKIFIANAAHEIQTPLAACINRLELLAERPTLCEEDLGEIIKARRMLDSMARLNSTLLLLARIDNGQFPDAVQIDLCALIRQKIGSLFEIYAGRNLKVYCEKMDSPGLWMDESLASVLFGNLLKNAYIHSDRGGRIVVAVTGKNFTAGNSGASALDPEKIFNHFYHKSDSGEGTGLGLPLAESICQFYDFRLEYYFEDGMHLFKVTFS